MLCARAEGLREREFLKQFPHVFRQIRGKGIAVSLMFLESEEKVLQRRFSETRRPHPLGTDTTVKASLTAERKHLRSIRAIADLVIDRALNGQPQQSWPRWAEMVGLSSAAAV